MNDLAREKLRELIARQGTDLGADPKRLRALLTDLCPGLKREVHVLVSAAEQRVPQELAAASDATPPEVLLARLSRRLVDDLALSEGAARWAVESWGTACGKLVALPGRPAAAPESPSPAPRPQERTPRPAPTPVQDGQPTVGSELRTGCMASLMMGVVLAGLLGYMTLQAQRQGRQGGSPVEKQSVSQHLPLGPGTVRPLSPDQVIKNIPVQVPQMQAPQSPSSGTGAVGQEPVMGKFIVPSPKGFKDPGEKKAD